MDKIEPGKKIDLYVVARFLEKLWESERPYRKTELQMAVGLNYNIFTKYLTWMEEKKLIVIEQGPGSNNTIRITKKGVATCNTLLSLLRELFGDAP